MAKVNIYGLRISNISGKRVALKKTFKTKDEAEKFKDKILEAKLSGIKRKGSSVLTGFNPRVTKTQATSRPASRPKTKRPASRPKRRR